MTPYELWIKDEKGMRRLTAMNRKLLRQLRFSDAGGVLVHGQ